MRDAPPDLQWPDNDMLTAAWGLIANASGGDWTKESPDWQAAAAKWRDAYVRAAAPAPTLTQAKLVELLKEWEGDSYLSDAYFAEQAAWLLPRMSGLPRLEAPRKEP